MNNTVSEILHNSNRIVFITGSGTVFECGGEDPWSGDKYFRTAKEYNVGPEALLSAGEYSSRKERFYRYYKTEILSVLPKPNEIYSIIKEIENEGRLEACISMNFFGLEKLASISKVIEIAGNLYDNYCPGCYNKFPVDYILNSKAVPVCEKCKKALRPNIRLLGERVNNILYTEAAVACQHADAVIILGASLYSSKIQFITGNYNGSRLILFAKEENHADKFADAVIYGNITENLKSHYYKQS